MFVFWVCGIHPSRAAITSIGLAPDGAQMAYLPLASASKVNVQPPLPLIWTVVPRRAVLLPWQSTPVTVPATLPQSLGGWTTIVTSIGATAYGVSDLTP